MRIPSSNDKRTTARPLLVAFAALAALGTLTDSGPLLLGGDEAHAVIGRPLTPVSYAGVARRTTRRAVAAAPVYRAPVVASTVVVSTLPAGCTQVASGGTVYYQCGTARYAPYYNGPNLVYRPL